MKNLTVLIFFGFDVQVYTFFETSDWMGDVADAIVKAVNLVGAQPSRVIVRDIDD